MLYMFFGMGGGGVVIVVESGRRNGLMSRGRRRKASEGLVVDVLQASLTLPV